MQDGIQSEVRKAARVQSVRIVQGIFLTSLLSWPVEMLQANLGEVHVYQIRKVNSIVYMPTMGLRKSQKKKTDSLEELPGLSSFLFSFIRKNITHNFQHRSDSGSIIQHQEVYLGLKLMSLNELLLTVENQNSWIVYNILFSQVILGLGQFLPGDYSIGA